MFSFLKRTKSKQNDAPDSTLPEAERDRMTLEERMAYRREVLYQSIRESLLQLQVISSMYKFRVMNLDARQHRFVAMIEVTSTFEAKINGMSAGFNQVEDFIRKRTIERYGVTLDTIFWRVNEAQTSFVRSNRAGESADAARGGQSAPRQREVVGDVAAARQRLARGQAKPVSAEEDQLEHISVKHLDYESEHAPLEPSEPTGGTQYGQL
jgi:cation diffusion facilitator CzcD-associated flavoprotein CzcO